MAKTSEEEKMQQKIDEENALLREFDFNPDELDDNARAEALAMARAQKQPEESTRGMKFFKTSIGGLSVIVGQPDPSKGEVAPHEVRFVPYHKRLENGEEIRLGYLATNNPIALKKLKTDHNVEEISEKEWRDATDPANKKMRRGRL